MAILAGRRIGSTTSFVAAGVFLAAAVIVGLIPYSESGYSAVCQSALQSFVGGTTTGQSLFNMFTGGRCTNYVSAMTTIMIVLFVLAIIALVAGIMLRNRAAAGRPGAPARYQGTHEGADTAGAPAQPGHAPTGYPAAETGSPADTWRPPAGAQGSGSFDTKLLLVGVGSVAGIVLLSVLIDWLSFLPGIVELLLWAAVGLTVIWQLKRRAAGTDPGELTAAEAWNPAMVARSVVAAVRHRLEIHRAGRREAERAQASVAPVTPEFIGDDGMAHPGKH